MNRRGRAPRQLRRPQPPGQATWRDIGHADARGQNPPPDSWSLAFHDPEVIRLVVKAKLAADKPYYLRHRLRRTMAWWTVGAKAQVHRASPAVAIRCQNTTAQPKR